MQSNKPDSCFKPGSSSQMVQQSKHVKREYAETSNDAVGGIIWLHGLNGTADAFDPIEQKLLRDFKAKKLLIIKPTCREEFRSIKEKIGTQAKNVFDEIKDCLTKHGKDLEKFPLIVIANSQGALVACNLYDNFGKKLNIKGMVLLGSPLTGTSVFERTYGDVHTFINNGAEGLGLMGIDPATLRISMDAMVTVLNFGKKIAKFLDVNKTAGLDAMHPTSPDIQTCRKVLRDDAHNRHDVIVASHQDDFVKVAELDEQTLSPEDRQAMRRLNRSYAQFLTGDANELHDGLIPTRSQLHRGSSLEDLTGLVDGQSEEEVLLIPLPGQSKTEMHLYKDVIHADNYIVLGNVMVKNYWSVPIPKKRYILYSEKVYEKSIKPAIEKMLNASNPLSVDELNMGGLSLG
ncbi:hypothetical protein [Candidatus Cardinium hertigii]|nr:hypothetical protein [Candidatus Cardinium hertigii]